MKRIDMRLRLVVLTALAGLTLAALSFAQTAPSRPAAPGAATGRITGKVTERGKEPVAFANVIVLGTKQGTQTDENGTS